MAAKKTILRENDAVFIPTTCKRRLISTYVKEASNPKKCSTIVCFVAHRMRWCRHRGTETVLQNNWARCPTFSDGEMMQKLRRNDRRQAHPL